MIHNRFLTYFEYQRYENAALCYNITMNTIDSISSGNKIIVRASLNVPLEGETILDDYRLAKLVPLLQTLVARDCVTVICGHIGREPTQSLLPVYDYLKNHVEIDFFAGFFSEENDTATNMQKLDNMLAAAKPGHCILLDNVRATPQEKANDQQLAKALAQPFDIYINDAFPVCHREHMSVSALAKEFKTPIAGPTLVNEIKVLSKALDPAPGSLAVLSGNKFDTKLPLLKRLVESYQTVVVGGALANTLYSITGHEIGRSLYDDQLSDDDRQDLQDVMESDALYLPELVIVETESGIQEYKHVTQVLPGDVIYDIDPRAFSPLVDFAHDAPLMLWNGPLGYYEKGYREGTQGMLDLFGQSSGTTIIGGGNTVDLVRDLGMQDSISHLSTGGGAMIEYLAQGSLPVIDILLDT